MNATKAIKANDHDALNAAFAEKVAGWKIHHRNTGLWCKADEAQGLMKSGAMALVGQLNFTRSADAVLPWLEKWDVALARTVGFGQWSFDVRKPGQEFETDLIIAQADSFPHAAVIALLRAHGVEVQENA